MMLKGIFRDTGLLNHLLAITSRKQLLHAPLIGQIFESAVIEENNLPMGEGWGEGGSS